MNIPDSVVEKAAEAHAGVFAENGEFLTDEAMHVALTAAFEELGLREDRGILGLVRYVSSYRNEERPVESSLKSEPGTSTLRPVEGGGDGDG